MFFRGVYQKTTNVNGVFWVPAGRIPFNYNIVKNDICTVINNGMTLDRCYCLYERAHHEECASLSAVGKSLYYFEFSAMVKTAASNEKNHAKISIWETHWVDSVITPPRKVREFTKFAKRGKETRFEASWHMYIRDLTRVYIMNEIADTIYFNSMEAIEWTMYQYQPVDTGTNGGCENQEMGFNN